MEASNSNKANREDSLMCLGACCMFITAIGVIGCVIAYIVFGIMYLVQDYDIAHDCDESALWAYVLTALILSLLRSGGKNAQDNDGLNFCVLVCLGLIELGLAIWGGVELWVKSCDSLINTNIWKFALATFILQSFVATLLLIVIPLVFILLALCNKNDTINKEDRTNNLEYGSNIRKEEFDKV